jgi:DtxR family Mn-dependent transcriptional regulator
MSASVENFVKSVFKLENTPGSDTRPGSIAASLGISSAATTDMAQKLALRELVNYRKYQPITLTPKGRKMALSLIRKHRLWETFLHKVLGLSLIEIHLEAEMLEHQTSDFLAEKISIFLGNPEFDPHGDPVPDAYGNLATDYSISLSEALPGENYTLSRLDSSEADFFDFCSQNALNIGCSVKVIKQYQNTNMTEIIVGNKSILLHKDFTNKIYLTTKTAAS